MLIDDVKIKVRAGSGGRGAVAFNSGKMSLGPTGATGGKGGDIYLGGVSDLGALIQFRYKKEITAKNGGHGKPQFNDGADGEDIILKVPTGTVVHDLTRGQDLEIMAIGQRLLIAKGGKGGKGNFKFRSSVNTSPTEFQEGLPGEEIELRLELKLIADVGFVGLPNVGKSSLLNELTNAQSKVSNYPFTTLDPNLGVYYELILADIPGLIEGASFGKGLGIKFLRHIERSRIIVHLLDITSRDPIADYKNIRQELKLYNSVLLKKPEIIAVNKVDTIENTKLKTQNTKLAEELKKITKNSVFFISAVTKKGVNELLFEVVKQLKVLPRPVFIKEKKKVFRPQEKLLRNIEVIKEKDTFFVAGKRLERIASQTDPNNIEALSRLYKAIESAGLVDALKKQGIKEGHLIKLGRRTGRIKDGKVIIIG